MAIARRDILLRERSQGFLNDRQTDQLLASLTLKLFQRKEVSIISFFLSVILKKQQQTSGIYNKR